MGSRRKWIIYIILLQVFLCTIEALRAVHCYKAGLECWPWFFAFVANIPASLIFERISGAIAGQFGVEAFAAQTALRFAVYFLGGSIWWMFVVLSIRGLVRIIKKRDIIGDRPQE